MKQFFFFLVVLMTAIACTTPSSKTETTGETGDSTSNVTVTTPSVDSAKVDSTKH